MLYRKIKLLIVLLMITTVVNAQFTISSTAFTQAGNIPVKYTAFNGQNVNPPLRWTNKPAGTQSFLLVLFDRTFCSGRPDTVCRSHWIVKDIPATATGIAEGTSSIGPLPIGAALGKSDNAINGIREYTGPFPDSTTIHLYEFKLYALNTTVLNCVTPFYNYCLQKAIAGKVIGTTSLYGYYLPRAFVPLPVTFVSVEAVCDHGKINCKWSTVAESSTAQSFTVERSKDGTSFTAIGKLPCTGNTNTLHEYQFKDSSNSSSGAFYRIKQTDRDGQTIYSYTAFVKCTDMENQLITVAPNPSRDQFVIRFNNPQNKALQIVIYDAAGRQVALYQSKNSNGNFAALGNNSPGVYLMKVSCNGAQETVTEKLVKLQ